MRKQWSYIFVALNPSTYINNNDIHGLVQDCGYPSVLMVEFPQSCAKQLASWFCTKPMLYFKGSNSMHQFWKRLTTKFYKIFKTDILQKDIYNLMHSQATSFIMTLHFSH